MAFDLEKFMEYIVAGCISAAIAICVILLAISLLLGAIIESATATAEETIKTRFNELSVTCSNEFSIDAIELLLHETKLYCKIS